MTRMGRGIKRLLQRFRRSQRGNVAMMAGIALPVLLMISAGAIDLHHMAKVRSELQDALDAATLAAARSNSTKDSDIQAIGMASLRANMPKYFGEGSRDEANFELLDKYQIKSSAKVQVKTIVANIFLPPYGQLFDDYMPMSANSEVLRASKNVEVAMALDVTLSMESSMGALREAAKELVSIIVQEDKNSPFQTRVALVPYAAAVNMGGSFAPQLRGPLRGETNIQSSKWTDDSNISATATVANSKITITTTSAIYATLGVGDWIMYTSRSGSATAVVRKAKIESKSISGSSYRFTLNNTGGTSSVAFRRCLYEQCAIGVTSNNHKLIDGDPVKISNSGVSQINTMLASVKIENENLFTVIPSTVAMYANATGGKVQCGADDCNIRIYKRVGQTALSELPSTNCVSNRPWENGAPYADKPGAGTWLGRAYMSTTNNRYRCNYAQVMPLNGTKATLNARIDEMNAGGSTAGHIGIEMAWYMLSPTMNSIFNTQIPAEDFDPTKTVKAAVLMTDGEFNTPFCSGVVVKTNPEDTDSNYMNSDFFIDCTRPAKAKLFQDAVAICDQMKAQGIVVYTIGFDLKTSVVSGAVDTAYEAMRACATSPDGHFHPVSGKANLSEAFKQIGRDITRLRIAR